MSTFLCLHININVYLNMITAWYIEEGRHFTLMGNFPVSHHSRMCHKQQAGVRWIENLKLESYMLKEPYTEKKTWNINKSVIEEEKTQQQQQQEKFTCASLNMLTVPEISSQILLPLSQTSKHKWLIQKILWPNILHREMWRSAFCILVNFYVPTFHQFMMKTF